MKVAILGDGVTAKAVRKKINEIGIAETSANNADYIIASPGIPPHNYPKCEGKIISEIEFAYLLLKKQIIMPRIIGVTGTNGKTTVTAFIAHVLKIPYAGNIGIPLISYVGQEPTPAAIVVELSSYQLEMCFEFKPDISIILNITPDHLARHGTIENYIKQKSKIFKNQTAKDTVIYWEEDIAVCKMINNSKATKNPYSAHSQEKALASNIQLIGPHNILNAIAVIKCARIMGITESDIKEGLTTFLPIEHRIEKVITHNKRIFINDSKSTNPDSTIVAVKSFRAPINLILGGKDKGLKIEEFLKGLLKKVSSITVFGEIANRVETTMSLIFPNYPLAKTETIEEAIKMAYNQSKEDEIILFSPACSSFDQFDNFEQRGRIYKEIIRKKYGNT
jgi:UDP-N-acetylmuramoylalanine--D-glutamate ligase